MIVVGNRQYRILFLLTVSNLPGRYIDLVMCAIVVFRSPESLPGSYFD